MPIPRPEDVLPDNVAPDLMRLHVLEMTVAAVAARLPEEDFFEVVSLLVFVARGADAMRDGGLIPTDAEVAEGAATAAADLLARMARVRRKGRDDDIERTRARRATPP